MPTSREPTDTLTRPTSMRMRKTIVLLEGLGRGLLQRHGVIMKKTMLAIGAFFLVSQAAQAQERGWLERAAREGEQEYRAWQTERRLHEQQRRLEDLEERQRLQQRRMEETANRLRYERLAAFGVL